MPEDLRYFENPYTGLLKEYHTGGLAVQFNAGAGPPAVPAQSGYPVQLSRRLELSEPA